MTLRRREFIAGASAAVASPFAVRAQQPPKAVIGWLRNGTPATSKNVTTAFLRGLSEAGYVEGHNVTIEYRWAGRQNDLLPTLAADLVQRHVDVLVTQATPAALAAKAATKTIPILFSIGVDPVVLGLVASYSRPGGNVTGVSALNNVLASKQLEILHETVPNAKSIGLLVKSDHPNTANDIKVAQVACASLGVQLEVLSANNQRETETAFSEMVRRHVEALVLSATLAGTEAKSVIELSSRYAIPTTFPWREDAVAGGLMSYGTDRAEIGHQLGMYTGRILKGEKPADLPVWEAVKVELVLNLKTAKTLGLTFPLPLLGRADEVIE
jgi:putative ABC transport system substrate-binding protein